MPKEILVYRGWIGAKEFDRAELEKMGIELGRWNPEGAFDYVSMTADVYAVFTKRWKGRGVWGLIGKRELVYSKTEDDIDIPF
jgi:hypothetical protein